MTPHIELSGVGHTFTGTHDLFRELSTQMDAGQIYGLVGPSGSGKSTLLSIIAGWMKPAYGHVSRREIDKITWVFQNPHGVARRTAIDHVALPFFARGYDAKSALQSARKLLEKFGLSAQADFEFAALSGGEAQRLMLARGIATEPQLLLIDEPTAQLDLKTGNTVNEYLTEVAQAGTVVVVATHDEHTRATCDHVIDLARFQ